ncbi:hypothetical protein ES319_A13G059500v1 [Gossypium barbadense]|uniref:Uncharacterized protein n=1 Tax=Gossypium barbadense TaxID=3634 RepID=A0A5J5SVF1_GOSBA|nr:hypothetical protein ES319_A13G059500v1 [Gossypium barbadense]
MIMSFSPLWYQGFPGLFGLEFVGDIITLSS